MKRAFNADEVRELAPVGSRWLWLITGQVEVIGYAEIDGEPAVRERVVKTGKKLVPTLAAEFFHHTTAVPS